MSGSDSAGVNAMVPGRKCEFGHPGKARDRSTVFFLMEEKTHYIFLQFLFCLLVSYLASLFKSTFYPLSLVVLPCFCQFFFLFFQLGAGCLPFSRCIVGVMRVRDFSTATEASANRFLPTPKTNGKRLQWQ